MAIFATKPAVLNAQNTAQASGTAPAGSTVEYKTDGVNSVTVKVSGNTLNVPITVQASMDDSASTLVEWETLGGTPLMRQSTGGVVGSIPAGTNGNYTFSTASFKRIRLTTPNSATTGQATLKVSGSDQAAGIDIYNTSSGGDASAANQTAGNASLASLDGKQPTVGQKAMAASSPVVLASDQSSIPVAATLQAGANLVGKVNVTVTAGEGTGTNITSAATTNATSIKASGGSLMEVTCSNPTATAAFVKFYNKASAPTVGTDVPLLTIPVAAGATVNMAFGTIGKRMVTGIAVAITGAAAATDTTAAVAGVQVSTTQV